MTITPTLTDTLEWSIKDNRRKILEAAARRAACRAAGMWRSADEAQQEIDDRLYDEKIFKAELAEVLAEMAKA